MKIDWKYTRINFLGGFTDRWECDEGIVEQTVRTTGNRVAGYQFKDMNIKAERKPDDYWDDWEPLTSGDIIFEDRHDAMRWVLGDE